MKTDSTKTTSKQKPKKEKDTEKSFKLSKMERKVKYNDLKRALKEVWTIEMETDEESNDDKFDAPSHYKKYTIQDRKIVVQKPNQDPKEPGTSYDGP
ncbi:hypothetical protein DD594_25590 [Enterobacter cloacae complex sp. 4DZ1-17B1]|uniref:hypothetical protein n=1 Tax=Enterobacter cloacae complex sp. 4DZ1-17B1 TaxID=2511991 RepID=UPI0010120EC6|nr:hypothetical protein [Enterobacter cloacae complex sp. 4DZ1-17B1]RYA84865.1 hypothetical protein DD594_25590 [Enterobacter cloacae complex sp. 4DZ1-17B1]